MRDERGRDGKGVLSRLLLAPHAFRYRAPVLHNLPRRQLTLLGRDRELAAVDEALRRDRRVTLLPAAALRFGGVGTTSLAFGYAQAAVQAGTYPAGVFWLSAAGRPADALARLGPDLRVFGPASARDLLAEEPVDAPVDHLARTVRLALAQAANVPSLLVLDDVDAEGWADRLPLGELRVLSTARDERFAFRKRILVPPLPSAVAADLGRALGARPRDGADRQALEALAGKELGGLPLAVELGALYVKHTGRSWAAYAGRVRTQGRLLAEEHPPPEGYAATVIAALDVSIERYAADTPPRRLLEGAAVFALEGLPLPWALSAADLALASTDEALGPLVALGLVTVDEVGQTLSLHRLVHRRVRDLVAMDAWVAASRRAASGVAVWLSEGVGPARLSEVDARRPHIDEALVAAERSGADLAWVLIAGRLAMHLERRTRYAEARDLFERALVKAERLDPPDPGQVRVCLSNLAGLLVETGEAREARSLLERALAIDDEPDEEVPSSVRLAKLSRVLSDIGNAEAARPLLESALALPPEEAVSSAGPRTVPYPGLPPIGREVVGDLPETARVLHDLKRAPGAATLLEQALSGGETDAPDLAVVLRAVDQAAAAPTSSTGPPTAAELTGLGLSLYALGHAGDARPLLERALVSDEAAYGPDHPEVAGDLMNLAAVLRSLGETDRARMCLERARAIAAAALPEEDALRRGIEARLSRL
jgi:tetratricopeptide (TPR) repeat protein